MRHPDDIYARTPSDFARAVGVSRSRVFELLKDGKLDSVKLGKKRLITTHPRDFLASLAKAGE